ncbi:MAG TPA: hypothetical protein PK571_04175, partial [Methylotenera sp.]|nr:hypothetical protein [Methylotenera sp.]
SATCFLRCSASWTAIETHPDKPYKTWLVAEFEQPIADDLHEACATRRGCKGVALITDRRYFKIFCLTVFYPCLSARIYGEMIFSSPEPPQEKIIYFKPTDPSESSKLKLFDKFRICYMSSVLKNIFKRSKS